MKTASNPPVQERGEKKIEEELMHDGGDDVYAPIIPDSIYSIYFISSPLSLSLSLSVSLSLSLFLPFPLGRYRLRLCMPLSNDY